LAVISGLALIALLGMSQRALPQTALPSRSPWTQMREGMSYMRHHQVILGVMLITLIMNALAFPYVELLPVFARDILHRGPVGLGLLGASTGVGSFVGLWAIHRLRNTVSNGWIFLGGSFSLCIVLIGFAFSTEFPLSLVLLMLSGLGQASFGVMQSSIILLSSSDEMRSRTMGLLTLFIGMGPFGRLQIGALAESFGTPFAVGLQSGMGALAVAIVAILLPELRHHGTPNPVPRVAQRG
jgi:predicted MFS family arabinose efflux permease